MTRPPVLVVIDDEPNTLSLIERAVRPEGYKTILHASAREALAALGAERPDVALVDLQMPEIGGLDVLRAIRRIHPECGVILMSASASTDAAIEAVKLGALDCLAKPIDIPRLRRRLADVKEDAERRAEILASDSATARRLELCGMIGRSAVMQELFDLVRRIAPHARAALVTGEHGTGKQAIARAIHELGPRRSKRFATLICSAVAPLLIESELFGHVRGAFSGATDNKPGVFEAADGGTLFLGGIDEVPPPVQARLMRVLETGELQRIGSVQPRKVDVRIVASTGKDLRVASDSGAFRSDLYRHLSVVELDVPALRDRREDIPYLTAAFVKEFAERLGKTITGVSPPAEQLLMTNPWRGNVRELRAVLERACELAEGRTLSERDLDAAMPERQDRREAPASDLGSVEREHIIRVLAEVRGNKVAAARRLGISRRTLYRRLERHGLVKS